MDTASQDPVIAFLSEPATYGVTDVARLETHASIVFLAGERAYKLKRAVKFDYLDFSTAERRRRFCELEVALNQRTAPSLYRGVAAVTREPDGTLALDGPGPAVDWLVVMNRFSQEALLDHLAVSGQLDLGLMPALAVAVAALHASAATRRDHGGRAGLAWVIDGNAAGFEEFGPGCLDLAVTERVTARARKTLEAFGNQLDRRRDSGRVRQCHGDLHLRNIVILDGRPTLFDGVEFNDEIACIDVWYDLAFLLMDLWHRGLDGHANAVMNRYLLETGDFDAIALLPLFLSCRAAVRAKVGATAVSMQDDGEARETESRAAASYLELADRLLQPPPPRLIAIGGFSGSGKSTLARAMAPGIGDAPGAVVLRSDEVRKQIMGVPLLEPLPAAGYAAGVTRQVYSSLGERAADVLEMGRSVIVDAVWADASDRQAIEGVAERAGVPFSGLWLDAPERVLVGRIDRRRHDASDADAAVVQMQHRHDAGPIAWSRIDAARPAVEVLAGARAILSA